MVDVVGDNHIRVGEHCAGDAFIGRINAAGHLLGRHAVGIDDGSIFVVGMLQHDAALVEAEQFAHQLQHDFQRGVVGTVVFA